MKFFVYKTDTGEILRTGICPGAVTRMIHNEDDEPQEVVIQESMLSLQAHDGETAIEGMADQNTQYVLAGAVTTYTDAEQSAKDNLTYGYAWAMPERAVVQILTDDEITAYLATQARAKRDQLLTSCDWTQTADQSSAIKTLWQPYRQDLRDITLQTGFPATIVWPTPPT